MNKDTVRQIVVVVATVVTLVANFLASSLPLNGLTTGEISDRFDVYFVPAGYVFSIWGLIYLGLIAYAIYQALPGQRENPYLRRIGYPFALSCVGNVGWLFMWHYELFPLTILFMVGLLLSLIVIYLRLDVGQARTAPLSTWWVEVPFRIYLGWITVATVANATSLLDYLNWNGWGISPQAWAVIMLVVGAAIAATISLTRGDIAYVLVIVWAFVGIGAKHSTTPVVAIHAVVLAVLLVLSLFWGVPRTWRRTRPAR